MEKQAPQPLQTEEKSDFFLSFKLYWEIFTHTWKYFVLSALVCLGLGYLYMQSSPRVYQRQSVMLIEDAEPSGSISMGGSRSRRNTMNSMMELNGISVGDNLKNEIFILTSQRLMERVVDSLGLTVDYTTRDGLHDVTIYRERPVLFSFAEEAGEKPCAFTLRVLGRDKFELSDFATAAGESEKTIVTAAGVPVRTPVGEMTLHATPSVGKFTSERKIRVTRTSTRVAAARFRGEISADEYDKESSLIVLTCHDNNEDRAEDLLNEIFRAYKNDVVENKNRVAENTARFIDERIALIGSELSEVENEMASFKQSNRIVDLQSSAQTYLSESAAARSKTIELETQLQVAKYLQDYLHDQGKAHQLIPTLEIPGQGFTQQIQQYNTFMTERNRLAENSSESAAVVRTLDQDLAALRKSIMASVDSYVRTVELQVREARNNEMQLSGQVSNVPEKEKQALGIERQQNLKAALYTYLLNKREEVALQLAINEANVRMVEYPMGGHTPVSPRGRMILFIALLIGLCLPAVIIYLRRLFDVTVNSRQEIEDLTTIPLAGELPHWRRNDGKELISQCESTASIVEAFRVLRYGINFLRRDARVFVCTSSTPGQGKSFVSSNLAITMAMAGKRVLLVDADIRRRTLSRKYPSTPGLTAYLIDEGDGDLTPYVVKDAIDEKVDFMPAGVQPPNPAELLMSDRLETLVRSALQEYDCVIFDATPAFSVADAEILTRVADMILYIVRVGVQERGFLKDLEKIHKSGRLKNMSIVVNDADLKSKVHYGYGYGYGYPTKHKKSPAGNLDTAADSKDAKG